MSKCGKGCLPECEYFTTGGCISPFNCMYKEESGYINSATSGTVIYTGGMNMTNEEMIENLQCVIADISEQCEQLKAKNAELKSSLTHANEECLKWHERAQNLLKDSGGSISGYEKKISDLQAENAELRERLEEAVEIPDYVFECINGKVERVFTEYLTVGELKNLEANGYSLTKEAAEARLAELKGEKE